MNEPIKITYTIKNMSDIRAAFRQAPMKMTLEIAKAIGRIIAKIENEAKKQAPVNKKGGGGNLRQSIISRMVGITGGAVEVGAFYAGWVHQGTRPHVITVRTKKTLADKREGRFFGKVVRHPGTIANPFLQRAVDMQSAFIDGEFEKAVINALK